MSVGAASPVPFSSAVCVPAASVKVSKPVAGPACGGSEFHLQLASGVCCETVCPAGIAREDKRRSDGNAADGNSGRAAVCDRHLQRRRCRPHLDRTEAHARRASGSQYLWELLFRSDPPSSARHKHCAKIVISPESGPVACGTNVTWIVQLAPSCNRRIHTVIRLRKVSAHRNRRGRQSECCPCFRASPRSGLLAVPKT